MSRHVVFFLAGLLVLVPFARVAGEDKKDESKLKLSDEEKKFLELTNKVRADKDLPPLEPNPILFKAARAHSVNMAKQEKLEHVLDGKNPAQRVRAAGYDFAKIGENVAWDNEGKLAEVVKGLLDSKLHRDNLLEPAFREIGLGIARTEKGEYYFTQVFAAPKGKK
jgi:uncharacterized protein YkwD